MITYKLAGMYMGQQNTVILRSDGACIPPDEANTDYQSYLKWLSEGNEPIPADEPQQSTVEPTPAVEVPVVTDPSVDEALPVEEPNEG
jgi:hypothetical protein